MKGLNRWVAIGLAFVFAAALGLGTANAEDNMYLTNGSVLHGKVLETLPNGSVKFKKSNGTVVTYKKAHIKKITHSDSAPAKKEEKKVEHRKSHHENVVRSVDSGVNTNGRLGYIFSDTASTPNKGQWTGAAGLQFNTAGSFLYIPVGGSYGVTRDLQLSANTAFYTGSGISGLSTLTVGGKYHFASKVERLNFAGGLDLSLGPLNNTPFSFLTFDPYGVVTYSFVDGLQLNGQLGIGIPVTGYKFGTVTVTPAAYVQFNAGISYPVADKLTVLGELDVNGQGSGVTPLVAGIRKSLDGGVELQAFAGPDFGGTVGFLIGGSAALLSE